MSVIQTWNIEIKKSVACIFIRIFSRISFKNNFIKCSVLPSWREKNQPGKEMRIAMGRKLLKPDAMTDIERYLVTCFRPQETNSWFLVITWLVTGHVVNEMSGSHVLSIGLLRCRRKCVPFGDRKETDSGLKFTFFALNWKKGNKNTLGVFSSFFC